MSHSLSLPSPYCQSPVHRQALRAFYVQVHCNSSHNSQLLQPLLQSRSKLFPLIRLSTGLGQKSPPTGLPDAALTSTFHRATINQIRTLPCSKPSSDFESTALSNPDPLVACGAQNHWALVSPFPNLNPDPLCPYTLLLSLLTGLSAMHIFILGSLHLLFSLCPTPVFHIFTWLALFLSELQDQYIREAFFD